MDYLGYFLVKACFLGNGDHEMVLMQAHHIPSTINTLKYTKLDEHIGRSISMYAEIFFPSLLTLRRTRLKQLGTGREAISPKRL